VPPEGWHRLSAGDGAKGPRLYDWAYATYPSDAVPGWGKGLLIRRPIAAPDELTFYLTHAPDTVGLKDLVLLRQIPEFTSRIKGLARRGVWH
jgi:hypothetical protein